MKNNHYHSISILKQHEQRYYANTEEWRYYTRITCNYNTLVQFANLLVHECTYTAMQHYDI